MEDSVNTSSADAAAAGAASAAVRAVQIAAASAASAGESLSGGTLPRVCSQDRLLHLLESGRRDDSKSLASGMRKLEPPQACNPPASLTAITLPSTSDEPKTFLLIHSGALLLPAPPNGS